MADRYTSRIALLLDSPAGPVDEIVKRAGAAGDIDRGTPVRGEGAEAMEVNWGGRMQRAVIRRVSEDGRHLLRTEAYVGDGGPTAGIKRQVLLLQGLARHVEDVAGVVDLEARVEHDLGWLNRAAVAGASIEDLISHEVDGTGVRWLHTHGAARFDVPDLELYGLSAGQTDAASRALRHVHDQLLRNGLETELALPDGQPVYLVPVLDAYLALEVAFAPLEVAIDVDASCVGVCARCAVVLTKARKCARCKAVHYCSRDCQTEHWATHRAKCVAADKSEKAS